MSFVDVIDPGSLTPAPLERDGQGLFVVKDPIVVSIGRESFTVPAGFATDGASIPFWARWIFNAWGRAGLPSVLHDFLREKTDLPKWCADQIFFMALRACGVPELRASLMYLAVRTHKSTLKRQQASFQSGAHSSRMADEKNPKPGLFAQTLAKAVDLWRILVGLWNSFLLWLDEGDRPRDPNKITQAKAPIITAARWEEIKEVAIGLPMLLAQLCICCGLVLNLCRAQVSGTQTADPLDGAALVSADLPQIAGWFWLMALWMVCATIKAVVKSITVNIVSKT